MANTNSIPYGKNAIAVSNLDVAESPYMIIGPALMESDTTMLGLAVDLRRFTCPLLSRAD
jgi:hypothetical protein